MLFSQSISLYSKILIGLIPPLGIGIVAWEVGRIIPVLGGPVVAILIGLVVGQIFGLKTIWAEGVVFTSKKILQGSIVLLGAGMSLNQVAQIGGSGLPVMIGTLAICLIGGLIIGRAMKVEEQIRSLVTYGTAICGASAIATMSVVMGASGPAIAVSITVIVLYNVLGAVIFPTIGHLLGLSQEAFGIWAGTAINDTSSVVAAATVYGTVAATYAVVVKLTRTLAIIPLALFESWSLNSRLPSEEKRTIVWYKLIPPFLILFILAAGVQSFGLIPVTWNDPIHFLAHFGTTVAMAAVGMSSSLSAIKEAGWKPVALGGILWFLVAGSSLILQWLSRTL